MAKKGIELTEFNGDTLFIDQVSVDGDVMLNRWNGQEMIYERKIPASDMVMLINLYRDIKDNNVLNDYINPNGEVTE